MKKLVLNFAILLLSLTGIFAQMPDSYILGGTYDPIKPTFWAVQIGTAWSREFFTNELSVSLGSMTYTNMSTSVSQGVESVKTWDEAGFLFMASDSFVFTINPYEVVGFRLGAGIEAGFEMISESTGFMFILKAVAGLTLFPYKFASGVIDVQPGLAIVKGSPYFTLPLTASIRFTPSNL